MSPGKPPRQVLFDPTPEIFATDSGGTFGYPLTLGGEPAIDTGGFDEARMVFSLWHPGNKRTIDLDSAYVELRASFDPDEEHWIKLAEIEPVVPPHNAGETFDGWIVLPVFAAKARYAISGSGFSTRARLQIRAMAYLVS